MEESVLIELDDMDLQLTQARKENTEMRSEIVNLRMGEVVDAGAAEEVRQTIISMQSEIAKLNNELQFYKGIMSADEGDHGLRIKSLDAEPTAPNRYRYNLILTQIDEKHDYIEGTVQLNLRGLEGKTEKALSFSDMNENQHEEINFRFKYFQNIDGELTLPLGFEPREFIVVARLQGPKGRDEELLERKFDWN